ncbi:hypothetical protein ONK20_25395, partial [Salmonella enterica subsp. enterica serovar Montevideo]|nr:hypothetical protein [Salmonella enterica subsp. enterica serovar Montevideo]
MALCAITTLIAMQWLVTPFAAHAADAISGAVERQPTNWQAIIMFLIFVVFTLGITYLAS